MPAPISYGRSLPVVSRIVAPSVKAFLNGRFLPLEEARVPVLDRGFIYADGIYELIPSLGGHLLRLEEHLDRLSRSLAAVRIADPCSRSRWREILRELVAQAPGVDLSVYLQVTRGVANRDHAFPKSASPTVFAMCNPLPAMPAEILQKGTSAILADDYRWGRCDIKSIALLANVLMRQQAVDAGASEAILVRDGMVTEAAAANVFAVIDGVIFTPPEGPLILPGITRALALELARANRMRYRVAPLPLPLFEQAEEIWLSSSTKDVAAVTHLNGQPVGSGQPGPVWERMYALFRDYKSAVRAGRIAPAA